MSRQPSDSFLPSGAINPTLSVPSSMPDCIPHATADHPISPPKTRSGSAEQHTAGLLEDWRVYAQNLRGQCQGQLEHMAADRARMEEVMAEERALWDKERDILKARITELEAELGHRHRAPALQRQPILGFTSPVSATGGVEIIQAIPQESGRNADGSRFYAPNARNPSRTFDVSESSDLRVDDVHLAQRQTAIRVTSKELTSSDFIQSPPSTHDLSPCLQAESIDISHIQPELEGVSIKASAVHPTFAAQVLSPRRSPQKLSPDIHPPPRDVTNLSRSNSKEGKQKMTLEVIAEPENRRLMHAGHTPNISLSNFSFLGTDGESGNATPTQDQQNSSEHIHRPSMGPEHSHDISEALHEEQENEDGDRALSGPLGLADDPLKNDAFLEKLVEKLEEARKSADTSPSNASEDSREGSRAPRKRTTPDNDSDDEKDDGPVLKLKPSINFGRPMGRI